MFNFASWVNFAMTAVLAALKKFTMLFVLGGIVLFFSMVSESFFTLENAFNLLTQNTYVLVAAIGLSFVMMGGALDLSVGYQISAVGVLTGLLMMNLEVPPLLAMAAGVTASVLLGAFNGMMSIKLKVHPIVITIGTMTVFKGISYLFSGSQSFSGFPDEFRFITRGELLGVRVDFWLVIVSILVASFIYNKTYYGRYVKAMGGNREAARLAGINVDFIQVTTFVISGVFIGLATFILMSRQGVFNSTIGPGTEFICMTGAMLGGIGMGDGGNRQSLGPRHGRIHHRPHQQWHAIGRLEPEHSVRRLWRRAHRGHRFRPSPESGASCEPPRESAPPAPAKVA